MEFLECIIQMDRLESEVTYGNGKPITNWVYFDKRKKDRVKIYENGTFIYEKYIK